MTFQRLEVMQRLWKKCPPQHVSLAHITALLKAFMGVTDKAASTPGELSALPDFANLPDIEE